MRVCCVVTIRIVLAKRCESCFKWVGLACDDNNGLNNSFRSLDTCAVFAANICFDQCFSVILCFSHLTSTFQFFLLLHTNYTQKINDMSKYISLIFTSKLVTTLLGDYIVIGIVWFITSSTLLLIFVNSNEILFEPCQLGAVHFCWKDLLHLSSINGTVDERVNRIYFAIVFLILIDNARRFNGFSDNFSLRTGLSNRLI